MTPLYILSNTFFFLNLGKSPAPWTLIPSMLPTSPQSISWWPSCFLPISDVTPAVIGCHTIHGRGPDNVLLTAYPIMQLGRRACFTNRPGNKNPVKFLQRGIGKLSSPHSKILQSRQLYCCDCAKFSCDSINKFWCKSENTFHNWIDST